MSKSKPTFDEFIQAIKENFPPDAQITNAGIDNLKEVFDKSTREQLIEAYRYAQKYSPLTPLSGIYKQLGGDGVYRPTFNERFHTSDGRRVEKGTDWKAVEERYYAEKDAKRKEYDAIHGIGTFDKAEKEECEKLHRSFVEMEKEPAHLMSEEHDFDVWTEEDKAWYNNLVKEVLEM